MSDISIPFCDLKRLYLAQATDIQKVVQASLESGWYILGKQVSDLEEKLLQTLVSKQGGFVSCNSGTDALRLALLAEGVGVGDEVITVSHTAIPTITAILSVGATPVLVDIDPETWVMDVKKIKITKRTKAIIPVHLYGNMVPMDQIQFSKVSIIEDVAQAHGSIYRGKSAGTLGDFGCYSFYPTKNLGALGDAGAVYASSTKAVQKLKMLRNYGQKDRYHAEIAGGINTRLDEVQAAVLQVRIEVFDTWNRKKQNLMQNYREALSNLPLQFQKVTPGCEPAWHLAVIALENTKTRDKLKEFLLQKGIETLIHYPIPNHLQKAFKKYNRAKLPVTEKLTPRILSLPLYPGLSVDEQDSVIQGVKSFFI